MTMARGTANTVQIFLIAGCGLTLVLSSVVRDFLPGRFLLDDQLLQMVIANPGVAPENESFHAVATFYDFLGLDALPGLASTVSILVLIICVILAVNFADWDRMGFVGIGVLALTLGLGLAYLAQYTKEFISLLVALAVIIALRLRSEVVRALVIVGAALSYGAFIRPYWALIAVMIPCVWLVLRRFRHPLALLACVVLVYVGLEVAFEIVRGESLGATRDWVNSGRADTAVATLIANPDLGSGPVFGVLAILLVAFQLVVPVPLFLQTDPYYMLSGLAILALWSVVIWAIVKGRLRSDSSSAWAASVLVALLLVQVIFEPDYGSYLKHLTPFLPLFLVLVPRRGSALTEFDDEAVGPVSASSGHALSIESKGQIR